MMPPEEEKEEEEEKNNPWTCFGNDDSGDASSGAANVTTTAETSEYFHCLPNAFGREDARGNETTLKRTREEEMRVLWTRSSRSFRNRSEEEDLGFFEDVCDEREECALMVTEQKRLKIRTRTSGC